MIEEDLKKLGSDMLAYCKKFNVPLDYLFEILEDQKVTPMIRGKAMEYNAFLMLKDSLAQNVWSVQKLNLNAQTGAHDEDISITHRRTGIILTVESKSSVRGSIKVRTRSNPTPHFKVKSHRSRSNISLAGTSNDRYADNSFDLLLTNPTNAIFQGNTVSEGLEIIHRDAEREFLRSFYNVGSDEDLVEKSEKDWRFVIPTDISENGFIPRTPVVLMNDDPNWKKFDGLEERLLRVVEAKRSAQATSRRS